MTRINLMRGFTLIEALIYIAIFSSIVGFLFLIVSQVIESGVKNQNRVGVEMEGDFVMRKIEWAMNGAQTINEPPPGATSSRLSVNRYNFSQNPVVIELVSSAVEIKKGASSTVAITSNEVSVEELTFNHIIESGTRPPGIKVTLTVNTSSGETGVKASTTLENTFYIRR